MKEPIKNRLLYYLPLVAIAAVAVFFTSTKVWDGDAILYGFIHAPNADGITYDRVTSLSSIWESQVNHYYYANGRFICHYLIQIFCGLLPRGWFDVFNGLAWIWLIVVVARFAGVTMKHPRRMPALASLIFLAYLILPFDPPHQMNYVWGAAINATFLLVFFTRKRLSVPMLALSALLGFIAGEWNESFSMPIALTVLVFVCRHRLRITPVQWVSGLAYGIGTIILCLAPGNFIRMGIIGSGHVSLINRLEQILPALIFPAAYLCIWLRNRKKHHRTSIEPIYANFLILTVLIGYIIGAALEFSGSSRMILCSTTALIILIIRAVHISRRTEITISVLLCMLTVAAASNYYIHQRPVDEKYKLLRQRYFASASGVAILPDSVYALEYTTANSARAPWEQVERSQNPAKPPLRIYPESLTRIDLQKDTNMCVPFMEQGWILIQSRLHPADFEIEKVLLPGLLNKKMTPRKVDFSPQSDILIDSTSAVRVAVYINERPYIQSGISLKQ